MMLAPSFSVVDESAQIKAARIFVENVEIKQSLFLCTRKNDLFVDPFITYLKEYIPIEARYF